MATTIDSLNIKIKADADSATKSIDKLVDSLSNLSSKVGKIDTKGLQKFSSSINILASGMNGLSSIKMPDYNRLTKGLNAISNVDGKKISSVANALNPLSNALHALNGVSFDNANLNTFVNALTRLSNSNLSGLNGTNFTQLGNNIVSLTNSLQRAKDVSSNTIQVTNSVARLASTGDKASATSSALPVFGVNLTKLVNSLATASVISDATIQFANAIGILASAGSKTSQAAAGLDQLAVELKKFFNTMKSAPQVTNNTIAMTNALANLAQQSRGLGNAGRNLTSGLSGWNPSFKKAGGGITGLSSKIGKFYASCFLLIRGLKQVGKAIDLSSQLTELQNVVAHTFANSESDLNAFSDTAIDNFGMSELAVKKFATRYQAMGKAMDIDTYNLSEIMTKADSVTSNFGNGLYGSTKSMSDMSINLTKLTADMASFYDIGQDVVAEDLESIFTGSTKPLRQYGIDITQANLKEWALKEGLDANIQSMTGAEKAMLRYQYVISQTNEVLGDYNRTQDTWHNQITKTKNLLQQLGTTVGTAFVNILKPVVKSLNNVLSAVNEFAEKVVNSLGKIFGWEVEITKGSLAEDFEDSADAVGGLADGTGKAVKNAKELKRQLQGFDELNVLNTNNDNGSGKGSGSGAIGGSGVSSSDSGIKIKETKGLFDSDWDTMYKLGKGVGDALKAGMDDIKWGNVYKSASNFGTGLASFLNGLFAKDKNGGSVFKSVGQTIAGTLNTILHAVFSFGKEFKWEDFGETFADGVNAFFDDFDFVLAAKTINTWVKGMTKSVKKFIKKLDEKKVLKGVIDFLTNLDLDTIILAIGAFAWKYGGKDIVSGALKGLLSKQISTGIGDGKVSVKTTLGLSLATAITGFKIGNWLYNHVPSIQEWSDALVKWLFGGKDKIDIDKAITVTLTGLSIALGAAKAGGTIVSLISGTLKKEVEKEAIDMTGAKVTVKGLGTSVFSAVTASLTAAFLGFEIGNWLYDNFDWVADFSDKVVEVIMPKIEINNDEWQAKKEAALNFFNPADINREDYAIQVANTWRDSVKAGMNSTDAWNVAMQKAEELGGTTGRTRTIDVTANVTNTDYSNLSADKKKFDANANVKYTDYNSLTTAQKQFVVTGNVTDLKDMTDKEKAIAVKARADFSGMTDKEKTLYVTGKLNKKVDDSAISTPYKLVSKSVIKSTEDKLKKADKELYGTLVYKNKKDNLTKDQKTVGGTVKFNKVDSSKLQGNKIGGQTAYFSNTDTSAINGKSVSLTAKFTAGDNSFDNLKDLQAEISAKFTANKQSSFSFTDANGSAHTVYKKDGGAFFGGAWHGISQFAKGGIVRPQGIERFADGGLPSHGTLFAAGEAGAEVVGNIGNRTEVLNQSQLASVMFASVANANAETNKILRRLVEVAVDIYGKEYGISSSALYNSVANSDREQRLRTGKSLLAY